MPQVSFRKRMTLSVLVENFIFSYILISAGADYEAPDDFTYTGFGSDDQTFNLEISEDSIAELQETIILQASVSMGSPQFAMDMDQVMINIIDDDGT